MKELTNLELDAVSGGGLFSFVGSAIIGATNAVNTAFSSPLGAAFGNTLANIGLGPLHEALDLAGLGVTTGLYAVGNALGGTGEERIHFYEDQDGGRFNLGLFNFGLFSGVGGGNDGAHIRPSL